MKARNLKRRITTAAKQSWKKLKPYAKKGWEKAKPYAKKAGKAALSAGTDAAKGYVDKKTSSDDNKSKVMKRIAKAAIDKGSSYASSKMS